MQCRSRPPREFLHMLNQVCWKSTRLPKSTCDRQRHPVDDCERKTTQYIMLRTAGRTKKQLVSGRAAATVCPRPSPPRRHRSALRPPSRRQHSSSFPRPTRSHVHRCSRLTRQHRLVTLTFDLLTLKVVFESRVTWATSVPILVFGPLCSRVRPDVRERQTDVRRPIKAPPRGGA